MKNKYFNQRLHFAKMFKQDPYVQTLFILTVFFLVWWVMITIFYAENKTVKLVWAHSYQIIAIFGCVVGFQIAKLWKWHTTITGHAIILITFGLLFQIIGQNIFGYYNLFLDVPIPYPSFAELGFFCSMFFYIYGLYLLLLSVDPKITRIDILKHPYIFFIPIIIVGMSYFFFLKDFQIFSVEKFHVFFDFLYLCGQVVYLSIAITVYIFALKIKEELRFAIVFLSIGLPVTLYLADYNFFYQAYYNTWFVGGYGDLLYFFSYFVVAFGLLQFRKIK